MNKSAKKTYYKSQKFLLKLKIYIYTKLKYGSI